MWFLSTEGEDGKNFAGFFVFGYPPRCLFTEVSQSKFDDVSWFHVHFTASVMLCPPESCKDQQEKSA